MNFLGMIFCFFVGHVWIKDPRFSSKGSVEPLIYDNDDDPDPLDELREICESCDEVRTTYLGLR